MGDEDEGGECSGAGCGGAEGRREREGGGEMRTGSKGGTNVMVEEWMRGTRKLGRRKETLRGVAVYAAL